ncbi:S-layer homology domain-containing protein [Micrococcus lylae]|uniref:S-layer homology domain-containing protein n=1 Tax=Micrococcus lylae TaxID=1273 RepID=A0ABY2JYU8_9MICC|nr:S-layer homology domain-containing protein [Micrococcus lylae]TFH98829.1 S-layer homology domain-containing protein [Micrococcus lylae]
MSNQINRRQALVGSAAATAAAAVGAAALAPSASAAGDFADVRPGTPFYKEITALKNAGIIKGWPDNTFRPAEPIKVDAWAAFLYRAVGQPDVDLSLAKFKDMTSSQPHYKEVVWSWNMGLFFYPLTGENALYPLRPLTRMHTLWALYNTEKKVVRTNRQSGYGFSGSGFADVDDDSYLADATNWASMGSDRIVNGYPGEPVPGGATPIYFKPDDLCLRRDAAAFLYRYIIQARRWSTLSRVPLPPNFARV